MDGDRFPHDDQTKNATAPVTKPQREAVLRQRGRTLWLTGLPASGKSTLAAALERRLVDDGGVALVLDGDRVREGLCRGLGFSAADRAENVRRVAEAARLLNDAGVICIVALISPAASARAAARAVVGEDCFFEVHVDAPLSVCEARDPKGHYRRARAGEVRSFTGISDPYDPPLAPALRLETASASVDACVERLVRLLATP